MKLIKIKKIKQNEIKSIEIKKKNKTNSIKVK